MVQAANLKQTYQAATKALQAGQVDKCIELSGKALKDQPADARALYMLARAYHLKGDNLAAIAAIREGLDVIPGNDNFLYLLHNAHMAQEDFSAAAEVLARLCGNKTPADPKDAQQLKKLASLQPHLKQFNWAKKLSRRAVTRNATAPVISQDQSFEVLSLKRLGQNFFYYNPKKKAVAIKGEEDPGANNWMEAINKDKVAAHELYVDYYQGDLDKIPRADVIYNVITEAEYKDELQKAAWYVDRLKIPVINHPRQVLKTSRDKNARFFQSWPDLTFPTTVRLELPGNYDLTELVEKAMKENDLNYPVIIRLPGFQTGKGMYRVNSRQELAELSFPENVKTLLLIEYLETALIDGLYRKYRAYLVGDTVWPLHVFISKEWNIHRAATNELDLRDYLNKCQKQYESDPQSAVGKKAWAVVEKALKATNLDVCGVDFSVDQDGKPVLFEVNPAMALRLFDAEGEKTSYYDAAFAVGHAFNMLLAKTAGVNNVEEFWPPHPLPDPESGGLAARYGEAAKGKIARNQKCPCGSGVKYKKCCGAA